MFGIGSRRVAFALGALFLAGSTLLPGNVEAQYGGGGYGGGGYGGGYDRPRRSNEEEYDRRRGPRDDFDRDRRRDYDGDRRRERDFERPRGGGGAPQARGGFVQSCRDIQQDGFYLSASCRMKGGGYRPSRIDVRSCRSIGNNDGRLVCE
jgi:hypothetical protein